MPNTGHIDYVPIHEHPAPDVVGAENLFPPTVIATDDGSSTGSAVAVQMTGIDLTVTAPLDHPLWEVVLDFVVDVSSDNLGSEIVVVYLIDGVQVLGSDRGVVVVDADQWWNIYNPGPTQILAAGDSMQVQIFWATDAGTATCSQPRLEALLRPYCPAAS